MQAPFKEISVRSLCVAVSICGNPQKERELSLHLHLFAGYVNLLMRF